MPRSASWCASRTHSKWRSNSFRASRDGLPSRRRGRPDGYPSNVDRISTGAVTPGSNTGVPKNRPILERAAPDPRHSTQWTDHAPSPRATFRRSTSTGPVPSFPMTSPTGDSSKLTAGTGLTQVAPGPVPRSIDGLLNREVAPAQTSQEPYGQNNLLSRCIAPKLAQ